MQNQMASDDAGIQLKAINPLATIRPATRCTLIVFCHSLIGFDMSLRAIDLLGSLCSQTSLTLT